MTDELRHGLNLIGEAIQGHFGERVDDYDEEVDDAAPHFAWEAFDALSRAIEGKIDALETIETVIADYSNPEHDCATNRAVLLALRDAHARVYIARSLAPSTAR